MPVCAAVLHFQRARSSIRCQSVWLAVKYIILNIQLHGVHGAFDILLQHMDHFHAYSDVQGYYTSCTAGIVHCICWV